MKKSLSKVPFWVRLSFDQFAIEKQIIEETAIHSKQDLKEKLLGLAGISFPSNTPPWEIRWCQATYLNQIVLILRVHQAIIDGTGLTKILVEQLADQPPPTTTTFIKTGHGTTTTTGYFKPRFGGLNFAINLCRAVIVGPLTFTLWMLWAFSRRKRNVLTNNSIFSRYQRTNLNQSNGVSNSSSKSRRDSLSACNPLKSIYWTNLDLPKILRIKQITRSCLNDVILAAIAGSIRQYLVSKCMVTNPPDLSMSIPVDIRNINEYDSDEIGVDYVMLTSPLPTNTEGAIPRLWEIRHLMEELKTSADPAVMFGVHYFLHNLLPTSIARFLINLIHRNSSVYLSNLQGPEQQLTIGSHRLRKIYFWMSPPPTVAIVFNVITYNQKLFLSVATTSKLLPCGKCLAKFFKEQINLLSFLLSRRRVPGETRHRKRNEQLAFEKRASEESVPSAALPQQQIELSAKLSEVQQELFKLTEELEAFPEQSKEISERLEELKEEFSSLMKEIRRRKSIAEYASNNIVINIDVSLTNRLDDDEDIDGELRPARRFSFASRRPSMVSAIPLPSSTRIQIASPLLGRRFTSASSDGERSYDDFEII
ncbi:putative diacylglycerol O-acyltransferase-like protein [Dinothrombium tinctorium]|uniref:Putative diacylglycerol O-acyltransferase-like protein n=1 Tax=Dinothrombium tinctorium TaxID=1965070 RepID=A0A443R6M8_9ACAR|nr:putative diacylglycerol O-acyltransferase-like protein [Dinothrombium tinctorium]